MKQLLATMAASLALLAGAQATLPANPAVNKYVDDSNKACPAKISESITQTAVALVGSDLTFEWTVEQDDAFTQLKAKRDLVRDAKVAELSMCDPSDNQLVYFVKEANVDLVFNLANKSATDTVKIRISKHDLY